MLTGMGLVPGGGCLWGSESCCLRKQRTEPEGASFQPQDPRSARFPREASERKGWSSSRLWSSSGHRGDAEVKPRAAGGAQSTRSVQGRSCCFGGTRLTVRPCAQPERLGAAQWPGAPRVPSFLAFTAPIADSTQRPDTGRSCGSLRHQFRLRSPGRV